MSSVINIRDAPNGWQNDPRYVYIGRYHRSSKYGSLPQSKWHNPFSGDRNLSILKYRSYVRKMPHLLRDIGELDGKILVCWCKPLPCHGDVLIELLEQK